MNRGLLRTKEFTVVLLALAMMLSVPVAFVTTVGATPGASDATNGADTTIGDSATDNTTATETTSSTNSEDSTSNDKVSGLHLPADASVWKTVDMALTRHQGHSRLQREQLSLARELNNISNDGSPSDERALDLASAMLEQRKQWAAHDDKPFPRSMVPLFEAQQTKVDASRTLLESSQDSQNGESLARAVAKAKQGTKMQAALASDSVTMSSDLPSVDVPNHNSPSAATLELMERYDVPPSAKDMARLQALDNLPEPIRRSITDFLNAFLAFQRATVNGNVTKTYVARNQLLDETVSLQDALENTNTPDISTPQSHGGTHIGCGTAGPFCVLSMDLSTMPNTYTQNAVVTIDDGGNDHYDMNAGGTNLDNACGGAADAEPAAALVDLGGHDNYTRTTAVGCGQRGGGQTGSGFLVDSDGTDEYGNATNRVPASVAVNGGAEGTIGSPGGGAGFVSSMATGFLLDAGNHNGRDQFVANNYGVNGGGSNSNYYVSGFLMNFRGKADYIAGHAGGNGGGEDRAAGFLADLGSAKDTYDAEGKAVNGGAIYETVQGGYLLDAGGGDTYTATSQGTNGGGAQESSGFLLDNGTGDDDFITGHANDSSSQGIFRFNLGPESFYQGMNGVNGGGMENGVGTLINTGDANDLYKTGDGHGSNGGGKDISSGLLVDTGGNDVYTSGYDPTAGATWNNTFGPKVRYPSCGSNGGGCIGSAGAIVDTGGKDTYNALDGHFGGINGTNGGGWGYSVGLIADLGTVKDEYTATAFDGPITGANGGGSGHAQFLLRRVSLINFPVGFFGAQSSAGTLVDRGGNDEYTVNATNTDGVENETVVGVNGGAFTGALSYQTGNKQQSVNAGHGAPAAGALVDKNGTDEYKAITTNTSATTNGVNGGAAAENSPDIATAVLLDAAGAGDEYTQNCGSGTDDNWAPKGVAGAQIDLEDEGTSPPVPFDQNEAGPSGCPTTP